MIVMLWWLLLKIFFWSSLFIGRSNEKEQDARANHGRDLRNEFDGHDVVVELPQQFRLWRGCDKKCPRRVTTKTRFSNDSK
jgi:hypothetical protein